MVDNKKLDHFKERFLSDLKIDPNIKEVTSEEEYWRVHKVYHKKLKKLLLNFKKMINYPDEFIDEYELIWGEMVAYGIVSVEFANENRQKVYKELNNPKEFVNWVKDRKIVKKINKKFNRK